ncbi:MAG: DUF2232 domain-containing protein [Aminipila sp.]
MYTLIIFAVLIFLPLPLMASSARKTQDGYKAIFQGVFGVAISMALIFLMATATGHPIGQTISADLQSFCEMAAGNDQFISMLGMGKLSFQERVSLLTQVYTYAINALPATTLVWATVISYFEYMFISKMSKRAKYPLPQLPPLKEFSMPKKALWGWILIYLMTLVVTLIGFMDSNVLQVNVQVLFQFAFQIQGIAVIFYFCDQKRWSKVVAIIICLLFLPTAIGQMLLCMLGFFDLGFGLRRMITKR